MNRVALFFALVFYFLMIVEPAASENADDLLIISNQSVRGDSLSLEEIRSLFLKRRGSWPAGGKVVPINAPEKSILRKEFRRQVLQMSETEETSYWKRKGIQAGDVKPVEFSHTLKAVFKLRGSISYIYRSQYREGVCRILLVLPKR